MPKRNGYEVAAFVKGHPDFKHIPVLLLAGAFEPVDQQRAEQVGCNGVLVKPFEPQHVIARVRELLAGAKGSATQATADVARPVERLAPPRTLEFPRREEPRAAQVAEGTPVAEAEPPAVENFDFSHASIVDPLETLAQPPGPDESLDDYFDRLDAAFATMDDTPSAPRAEPPRHTRGTEERLDVPTLDDLLGPDFAASPAPIDLPLHAVTPPPVEPPTRSLVADAFAALLAVEQGDPGAKPVRLTSGTAEPVITDALVDELTRRVIARLAPDAVRAVVAEVVSEVAERLVREEIDRIRNRG